MELVDGQLVYLTQYEIPDAGTVYDVAPTPDVNCPVGTAKTYRFAHKFDQTTGEIVSTRRHIGSAGIDLGVDFNLFSMPQAATISATFSLYQKFRLGPAKRDKLYFSFSLGLPF